MNRESTKQCGDGYDSSSSSFLLPPGVIYPGLTGGLVSFSGQLPVQSPSQMIGPMPPQMIGPMPPQMIGPMPPQVIGQMLPQMIGQMPPQMAGQVPPQTAGQLPGQVVGQVPPQMVEQVSGQMAGQIQIVQTQFGQMILMVPQSTSLPIKETSRYPTEKCDLFGNSQAAEDEKGSTPPETVEVKPHTSVFGEVDVPEDNQTPAEESESGSHPVGQSVDHSSNSHSKKVTIYNEGHPLQCGISGCPSRKEEGYEEGSHCWNCHMMIQAQIQIHGASVEVAKGAVSDWHASTSHVPDMEKRPGGSTCFSCQSRRAPPCPHYDDEWENPFTTTNDNGRPTCISCGFAHKEYYVNRQGVVVRVHPWIKMNPDVWRKIMCAGLVPWRGEEHPFWDLFYPKRRDDQWDEGVHPQKEYAVHPHEKEGSGNIPYGAIRDS